MKIYLAGKIGGHNHSEDWRYELLKDGEDFFFSSDRDYQNNPSDHWLSMRNGHQYVGPFAIDEGSGHGWGRHSQPTALVTMLPTGGRSRRAGCPTILVARKV